MALCSCLKNLSWKVKTQFFKTNLRSCQKTKEVLQHFNGVASEGAQLAIPPGLASGGHQNPQGRQPVDDGSNSSGTGSSPGSHESRDVNRIDKCMALLNDTKV